MPRSIRCALAAWLLALPSSASRAAEPAGSPVAATIDTTLGTASGQIRQFAFDGDDGTSFASEQDAGREDQFTLVFDKPVSVKSVAVKTGRPDGGDGLDAGTLEVSTDGRSFVEVAKFADGAARWEP